jgi:hypothetical protein
VPAPGTRTPDIEEYSKEDDYTPAIGEQEQASLFDWSSYRGAVAALVKLEDDVHVYAPMQPLELDDDVALQDAMA